MIGGVYRFRMNSICVCGGEQGLGAGKCTAWNCQNGNRVGVVAGCAVVAVHSGTSPETLMGAEGASVNTAMSVVLVVW